eukprot:CAMPEP_0194104678 /NCGR_PEP_ID=MMETSP0150-20130528/5015_1 /TAXON_ID=122233 /ORGANISM="Chaetoceros debilis, Strain MM31A-1" /LENGTH=269 /DNA_ID=CAMNT_0038792307 /DNA_START=394 /DNA_END=1201 /DNA_ORIENTATION=-
MTSREEVSEEVREEVEADCISLAEPRDGIVSECNSHSTINTNQALSTVTLGFCDSIPTPCQHSCVNDKALDHNHDSGKTFCDSSTNEIRTSLVSCDSSTPQESCTPSVVTDDIHFQHKGSVGADTISTLRSLVLRRRVDDVYTKRMAKGEILGDNILKPPIQSERLQNLLVVTSTDQTIRYPLTRNTSSPRPSVRSTVLPPKRVYNQQVVHTGYMKNTNKHMMIWSLSLILPRIYPALPIKDARGAAKERNILKIIDELCPQQTMLSRW